MKVKSLDDLKSVREYLMRVGGGAQVAEDGGDQGDARHLLEGSGCHTL